MKLDYKALTEKMSNKSHLWSNFKNWYIAGGYLRDTLLGKDVKDVDIFVSSGQVENVRHTIRFKEESGSTYCYGSDPDIISVSKGTSPFFDKPVDIIEMAMFVDEDILMRRFYAGLCRTVWGPQGLVVSPDFIHDAENEVITHYLQDWHTERIDRKLKQLGEKYPNFSMNLSFSKDTVDSADLFYSFAEEGNSGVPDI